jgi:hypothetical protein
LLHGNKDVFRGLGVRARRVASRFKTSSNPKVFYTNVYLALKRDKEIKKTGERFRLKAAK